MLSQISSTIRSRTVCIFIFKEDIFWHLWPRIFLEYFQTSLFHSSSSGDENVVNLSFRVLQGDIWGEEESEFPQHHCLLG